MGSSSSKTTVKNVDNKLLVNKSDIDILNQTNNTLIANTIINNASNSTAALVSSQKLIIRGLHAKGDVNINGASQTQTGVLSFKNLSVVETQNDASNAVLLNMMNNLLSKVDTTALSTMMANAESNAKIGALSMPGWVKSNSASSNETKTSITNETKTKLQNVIANAITNNFTTNNISNCIASVSNNQDILVSDIVSSDGSINITGFSQTQAASLISSCITQNNVSNKIVNNLTGTFGVTIVDDKKTDMTTEQTGESSSTAQQLGIFDYIETFLTNLFGSSYLGIGIFSSVSVLSVLCCCCVILILLLLMFPILSGSSIEQ